MQPTASDDEQTSGPSLATRDFSMMSEDEQVAYAMQMSMDPTSVGLTLLLFFWINGSKVTVTRPHSAQILNGSYFKTGVLDSEDYSLLLLSSFV